MELDRLVLRPAAPRPGGIEAVRGGVDRHAQHAATLRLSGCGQGPGGRTKSPPASHGQHQGRAAEGAEVTADILEIVGKDQLLRAVL